MKKNKKSAQSRPARVRFPEDEAKHSWLPLLLDSHALVHEGVAAAIRRETRDRGRILACRTGCSNCCRFQTDIAVYPVELVGISWYAVEKTGGEFRSVLKEQLSAHDQTLPCPFLVQDRCSIYPLRPMSCRQFTVFTRPCEPGEDPYFTRREDVLKPVQDYLDRAIYAILPFFGVQDDREREEAVKAGMLKPLLQNLQACNWKSLARRMDDFDSLHTPAEKNTRRDSAG